ncbi:MAG: signal recognition particle protein [Helicobacteraceae bacterium]|nr:signal recognition particle protein [Helicobacteraceae bacterium]
MFSKITESLKNAVQRLRHFDDEASLKRVLEDLKKALLKSDVHHKVVKELIAKVEARTKEGGIQKDRFAKALEATLFETLAAAGNQGFVFAPKPPTIALMCGLQGSGKTTTSAKLAKYLKERGKKVLLAGADLQRAAAVEQLKQLAEQIDVEFFAASSAIESAKGALKRANDGMFDALVIDTAGRLAIDEALMKELETIKSAVNPHETFYVADSLTGQDAIKTAEQFHRQIALSGVVLTKFDGDATGGIAISLAAQLGIPLRFVGTGEKPSDLEIFIPERIVSRLMGGGDIAGLSEKVAAVVDEKRVKELDKKIKKGSFNFNDFLQQIEQVSKLGNMKSLLSMIPGGGSFAQKIDDMDLENSKEIRHIRAMIMSMTPREREEPEMITASRKQRIAKGSGLHIDKVNRFFKQFRNGAKIAKQFSGKGGLERFGALLNQQNRFKA